MRTALIAGAIVLWLCAPAHVANAQWANHGWPPVYGERWPPENAVIHRHLKWYAPEPKAKRAHHRKHHRRHHG